MKVLLKMVVILSANVLALAAPSSKEIPIETTPKEKELSGFKSIGQETNDSASTIKYDDQTAIKHNESPIIKEILDKLDKSDITKVIDEEKTSKTKSLSNSLTTSEIKRSDGTPETPTKHEVNDSSNEMTKSVLKKADDFEHIEMITKETNNNAVNSSDYSTTIDKQLKDVASAVAEVVTGIPVPVRPDTPSKYTEVVGHFISELLQIPMVLLHAVSNAIASLTNNKVNIPSPTFLIPVTQAPH